MVEPHPFSRRELIHRFEMCFGKTFGEIDRLQVFQHIDLGKRNKGVLGAVIEQSVLGLSADSEQRPDLLVDGVPVELKTTGLLVDEDGSYRAKEPMTITAVSPDTIVTEEFVTSNFWHKAEHLLIVWYVFDKENPRYDQFILQNADFHEWDEFERMVLAHDWELVRDYIVKAKEEGRTPDDAYPGISTFLNPQLMFIDTSPRWPNPPRFRLKNRTVTAMARKHFGERLERLPRQFDSYAQIDELLHSLTNQYKGRSINELCKEFGLPCSCNNKGIGEALVVRMFGGTSKKMCNIELFEEIGLIGKTVVFDNKNFPREQMKLFPLNLDELWDSDALFETSQFRDNFIGTQLLCIIFEEPENHAFLDSCYFVGFKRVVFSEEFVETEVRSLWDKTRSMIANDTLKDVPTYRKDGTLQLSPKTGQPVSAPNFPKSDSGALLIKGTGQDATKKIHIHGIRMYRQQNIWATKEWVSNRLQSCPYI